MKATGSIPAVLALFLFCIAAVPVAALAAPDLVVQTFDPPSGAVERNFSILNAVRNAGTTGSVSGFTVGFVLSSDTTFNLDDTLIGTRELRALAAGITSPAVATNISVPGSVPDGTYYLGMFVDTGNTVAESNEANNFLSDPDPITLITPTPTPDLPPGPVTGLQAADRGTTWIRWEWTDPADADLDHVTGEVLLGGDIGMDRSFTASRGVQSWNATGLVPGSAYEIALLTYDAAGKEGGYVRHSAFTARDPSYQEPYPLPVFGTDYSEIYDLTTNESSFVFAEARETAVYVFSPSLVYLGSFVGDPHLEVSAVAAGPGDTIYAAGGAEVSGQYVRLLRKYSSTGQVLADWVMNGTGQPVGLAVDGDGYVYALVANHWSNPGGRFEKYAPDGTFLFEWGSIGSGPGQLGMVDKMWGASDIAVDADGNLFVADTFNHRIQKFDSNGIFLLAWGSEGEAETEFNYPTSVAVDPQGNVTVTDHYNHRIKRFTGNGQFITAWSCQEAPIDDPHHMRFPMRVTVAENGITYVSGTNNLIVGFAPGGTVPTPTPTTVPTISPTILPTAPPVPGLVPGGSGAPTDTGSDGKYEDVNGNTRKDFADVVLYFNQMIWITAHEPVYSFDFNGNARIDFADVVWLFNHL